MMMGKESERLNSDVETGQNGPDILVVIANSIGNLYTKFGIIRTDFDEEVWYFSEAETGAGARPSIM